MFLKLSKKILKNSIEMHRFQPRSLFTFQQTRMLSKTTFKHFKTGNIFFGTLYGNCSSKLKINITLKGKSLSVDVTFFSLLSPGFADAESNQSLNLFCFLEQSFCLNKKNALLTCDTVTFSSCKYSKNECSDISRRIRLSASFFTPVAQKRRMQ